MVYMDELLCPFIHVHILCPKVNECSVVESYICFYHHNAIITDGGGFLCGNQCITIENKKFNDM